jgi:hypothetical protein
LDNTCTNMNAFWHKRLLCTLYQRWASGAPESRSRAAAGGGQVQCRVPQLLVPLPAFSAHVAEVSLLRQQRPMHPVM